MRFFNVFLFSIILCCFVLLDWFLLDLFILVMCVSEYFLLVEVEVLWYDIEVFDLIMVY